MFPRPSRTHRPPRPRALCSSRCPGPPTPLRSRLAPCTHFLRAACCPPIAARAGKTVIGGGEVRRHRYRPAPRAVTGSAHSPGRERVGAGQDSPTGTGAAAAGREAQHPRPLTPAPDSASQGARARMEKPVTDLPFPAEAVPPAPDLSPGTADAVE